MEIKAPWLEDTEAVLPRFGVDEMPGPRFEELVAELLQLTGFETNVTPRSGDLGADIIAESENHRISVQAKRYGPGNRVSRSAVSDAIAARAHYDCNEAMVVTNREFSRQVAEFAADRCYLIDRTLLAPWLDEHLEELSDFLGGWDLRDMPGSSFEAAAADLLRDQGYDVDEVGGTGDYGADLIAEKGGRRWTVQVKRQSTPVSREAVSDAVAAKEYYNCTDSMVITSHSSFTSGAQQLASDADCELVGRSTVQEWMEEYDRKSQEESEDSKSSFRSPQRFLGDIEWYRKIITADIGPFSFGESELKTSGLLATKVDKLIGPVTIRYENVPPRTWLALQLPSHPQVDWQLKHSGYQRGSNLWLIPLKEGSGQVRLRLHIEPPPKSSKPQEAVEQINEVVDYIAQGGITGGIHLTEPSDEQLEGMLSE